MKKVLTKVLTAGAAASMVVGLAACGSKPAETAAAAPAATTAAAPAATTAAATAAATTAAAQADGPVTLKVSWWGGDSRHNATLAALDEYMKANPNVTVEADYGAWSGWTDKVATQLAGNSEPDLMQINWNYIYQFSSDGLGFADMNDLKDSFDMTQYDQKLLDQMTIAGHVLGIPVSTTGRVFYWNPGTFEKAGLEVPKTFADIIAAGQTFKEKLGDDYYPMACGDYDRTILMTYYLQEKYNKAWVENGQCNFTVEEMADGFDFLKSLEDNHVMPTAEKLAGDGADSLDKNPNFIEGKYAGLLEWDSSIKKLTGAQADGQTLVIGEYPADFGTPSTVFKISMAFAVSKNSKNQAEAAKLLDFLLNGDGVATMALERGIPSSAAAQKTLQAAGAFEGLTYDANIAAASNYQFALSPYYEASSLKDSSTGAYAEIMDNMSYDRTDSKELAQQMIDAVNNAETTGK